MNASAHLVTLFDVGSHAPLGSSLSLITCHPCTCASLLEFDFLLFYFDLSFTVLSFFFPLLHFELHTELDNLIAMQNLRTSANKGSDDAHDVHTSLTRFLWLQDKVSKGELKTVKVGTADQLADFLTKPVAARWLAEKSPELGLEFREGRSSLQRGLVSGGAGANVYVFDTGINVKNGCQVRG